MKTKDLTFSTEVTLLSDFNISEIKISNLSNDINNILSTMVDKDTKQDIYGKKNFIAGIDIGDNIFDVGNNCFAVGNDLSVGSYNFFYKGIDFDKDNKTAVIYLTKEQPRYPYPFLKRTGETDIFYLNCLSVNKNDLITLSALSGNGNSNDTIAKDLSNIWNCTQTSSKREDYNQLCIDFGGTNYKSDLEWVKNKIFNEYFIDAFQPETDLSIYNLESNIIVNDQITMVNNDKIAYLRCGKVLKVFGSGSILSVELDDKSISHFDKKGIQIHDYDYDDASLVFIDKPTLSGPANTSTYSSVNIGAENKVLRRCSLAVGKQNTTESDFCIALGRQASANHYCSFVWAPAKNIKSVDTGTFTIGLRDTIANYLNPKKSIMPNIYVADAKGNNMELHKFIWGCISSDNNLKTEIKNWLGIS